VRTIYCSLFLGSLFCALVTLHRGFGVIYSATGPDKQRVAIKQAPLITDKDKALVSFLFVWLPLHLHLYLHFQLKVSAILTRAVECTEGSSVLEDARPPERCHFVRLLCFALGESLLGTNILQSIG
jgi:hypothetical protein